MAAESRSEYEEGRPGCEEGGSVCVGGLPADMEQERLADKLLIHFLRSRNGGGEITSVNIKEVNRSAVITFEDSKVALNVLSHCPHILKVDGKEYKLSLSVPGQESSLLNKVILDMSVTIDCSQLPLGEETVRNLCKKYPDLRVKFIKPQRHCTLRGLHSEIQAVLSHLVELLRDIDPQGAACSSSGKDKRVGSGSLKEQEESRPPDSLHGLQVGELGSLYHEAKSSEILPQKSGEEGNSMDLPWEQEHFPSSGDIKGWIEEADAETQSLIMEADVFAYLSSKSERYKHILLIHGVRVVDATSDGVTTLYLQSDSLARTRSEAAKHMNQASKELSQLYQQLEGNLRRAQVLRSMVGLEGGDTNAFKELQSLLPKVLLTSDQTYLYIVGESSEVSQAKQMLLLGSGNGQELSPVAKPSCPDARQGSSFSSTLSNCYTSTSDEEATQMYEKRVGSRTAVLKTNVSSTEQKARGTEGYKLAARFKNSELGLPGFHLGERGRSKELRELTTTSNRLTLASNFEPLPPLKYSLGSAGALSGDQAGGSLVGPLRVTSALHSEDILFNNVEPFGSPFKASGSLSSKVSGINSTEFTSTFTPGVKTTPSISQNVLAALDTPTQSAYPSTARTSLKRSSSFSGRPSPKLGTQKTGITERSRPATGMTEKQAKSSSLTNSYTVSEEVIVPSVMWNYIKEAYRSRLDAMISDLQVTEILSDKDKVRVILKGPESSEVEECRSKLQRFIAMIDTDFYIQEHQLADLCVSESSEAFKTCCSNIRSRFSKISVQSTKDTVLLIGPKSLCLQATEMLKEVFFHEVLSSVPPVNSLTPQEPIAEGEVNDLADQMRPNETKAYTEGLEASRRKSSQSEAWTVSFNQSPKQKNSGKEKAKEGEPGCLQTNKTLASPSQSPEVSEVEVGTKDDWTTHLSLTTQRKQKSTSSTTAKQTGHRVRSKSELPLLGQESALPHHDQNTSCSKAMTAEEPSQKLPVHLLKQEPTAKEDPKGKVVSKVPKHAQGIQGTMRYAELSQTLQGYHRYTTVKITYCIPDGIQGEADPNPGSPFKGGVFEAYLPLNPVGQALLPKLEKAFKQGLSFRVFPPKNGEDGPARIWWNRIIPHKTKMEGGKSGNGYPDSSYLSLLSEALKIYGIKD
ncbi:uncharacterized protein si:busm1-163l24.3 [Astyanax mexicanus]|uniref:uncharacterized protein si:busm1-163l24.3 n=1 Tax=Astyanax mexicanus TaxID=7994 RepID=UPI0020CB19AD|nr:uncharacterized protein si:busm1-163l24.3 [Astyanax mexicanus]XP_022520728.2 uncharacterized protein si:busm1-163l24.3 [Astyanax mexicanus]